MNTLIFLIDKVNGGYDYIEIDHNEKRFKIGYSGSHNGHYKDLPLIEIEVKTKKELKRVIDNVTNHTIYQKDTKFGTGLISGGNKK